jgi:hypothetical protein
MGVSISMKSCPSRNWRIRLMTRDRVRNRARDSSLAAGRVALAVADLGVHAGVLVGHGRTP